MNAEKTWMWTLCLLCTGILAGCGGEVSSSPPNDDVTEDTTAQPDVDPGDVADIPLEICPGLFDPQTCEAVEVGSTLEEDANTFSVPCFDEDNDRYPDNGGDNPIYVDSSFHWFGEGDGSLDHPFISLGAATAIAQPGDTIIVAQSDADDESDGVYEGGFEGIGLEGIRILGVGDCDENQSVITHTGSGPAIKLIDSPGAVIQGFKFYKSKGVTVQLEGDATDILITHNRFRDAGVTGVNAEVNAGENLQIRDNLFKKTTASGCGIQITGGSGITVENNIVSKILGVGICAYDASSLTVSDNLITDCEGAGITLNNTEATVHANSIYDNEQGGVGLAGATTATLTRNHLSRNQNAGIVITSTGVVDVVNNLLEENHTYAITASQPNGELRLTHCDILDTEGPAIALFDDTAGIPVAAAPTADGEAPLVQFNRIDHATGSGIFLQGVAQARLLDNHITNIDTDEDILGDGVSARESAVLIQGGVIAKCARYGLAFADAKGTIQDVTFEDVNVEVACKANTCSNISYPDGLPEINPDPIPESYTPIKAEDLVP